MTLAEAIEALVDGDRVAREGWEARWLTDGRPRPSICDRDDITGRRWTPTTADASAEDWRIVTEDTPCCIEHAPVDFMGAYR